MAGRSRKPVGPKDLCAYVVEVQEQDGKMSVPPDFSYLVRKCIEDKIFSENRDIIAVCRSDMTSNTDFVSADWDGLRKALKVMNQTRNYEDGVGNPITCMEAICDALVAAAQEDEYDSKKILFFAHLSSYILSLNEVDILAEKLFQNGIFVSIILPNKEDMSDIQVQNSKLLRKVFNQPKYLDISSVATLNTAKSQILNTMSKKVPRPSPWNVLMEITPEITINVSGYVCTRKNKMSDMTRVLMKQVEADPTFKTTNTQSTSGFSSATASTLLSKTSAASSNANQGMEEQSSIINKDNQTKKTVVVDVAKNVLEKEKIWTGKDGSVVEDEDIGKGYYFGDKLIPFNELEKEDSYQSGEKCFKVLVFCTVESINPAFHIGDGTTLFYPKKDDSKSEAKFLALMKAMVNTNRIALVRKVYLKNKKVTIGTLFPDEERQCLVFSEVCFADDVSIPYMPLLIKPEEMIEEGNEGINEKESLIDELIKERSLDDFCILDGPADPAVGILRNTISTKVLKDDFKEIELTKPDDSIEIFFQRLVVSEDLISKLRESFPVKVNKVESERLAGTNIFRKRMAKEELVQDDKKPKLEVEDNVEANKDEDDDNMESGINDLLDEL